MELLGQALADEITAGDIKRVTARRKIGCGGVA